MADGTAISAKKEVEDLNGTAEEKSMDGRKNGVST
jgi:hypothetical protein